MIMSNKVYDIIASIGRFFLPGIAALYVTVGNLWGFPFIEQISGTLTALAVLVNGFCEYEKSQYNKAQNEV